MPCILTKSTSEGFIFALPYSSALLLLLQFHQVRSSHVICIAESPPQFSINFCSSIQCVFKLFKIKQPPPSPRTKPSLFLTNGREAVFDFHSLLKSPKGIKPMPEIETPASEPPEQQHSVSKPRFRPSIMVFADSAR